MKRRDCLDVDETEVFRSRYSEDARQKLAVFYRHAQACCPYFDAGRFWLITSIDVEGGQNEDNEAVVRGKEVSGSLEERRLWHQFATAHIV